jgi:hypothetical protein
MSEVSTIGLDIAKEVFRVHGADAAGAVVFRKRLRRTAPPILCSSSAVQCCDGSLRVLALLEPRAFPLGS